MPGSIRIQASLSRYMEDNSYLLLFGSSISSTVCEMTRSMREQGHPPCYWVVCEGGVTGRMHCSNCRGQTTSDWAEHFGSRGVPRNHVETEVGEQGFQSAWVMMESSFWARAPLDARVSEANFGHVIPWNRRVRESYRLLLVR
jgi:hypothetical protein